MVALLYHSVGAFYSRRLRPSTVSGDSPRGVVAFVPAVPAARYASGLAGLPVLCALAFGVAVALWLAVEQLRGWRR